jgi:single-strand DNA-binding protein
VTYGTINKATLIGRLAQDPELRAMPNGQSVCTIRLVVQRSGRADDGLAGRESTFEVVAFDGLAESIHRYCRKGRRVAVDGWLEQREWETAEGVVRSAVEVRAETALFLGGPASDSEALDRLADFLWEDPEEFPNGADTCEVLDQVLRQTGRSPE